MESPNADHVTLNGSPGPLGPRVASPSLTRVSDASAGTGETLSPSGLLLFQPCDETGERLRPSLTVADPDGTIRGGIDLPHPFSVVSTNSGCRAVVSSGTGETYVVDGSTRAVIEINLGERSHPLAYEPHIGGKRWGLFQAAWRAALVDFATGRVTDLRDIEIAHFSPDGETLAVVTRPDDSEHKSLWLIPAADPSQLRSIAISGIIEGFNGFDGEHLLLKVRREDRECLVVVTVADGTESVIAHEQAGGLSWPEPSQLLPGRAAVAVLRPDRFAVIALNDGNPREVVSVKGGFVTMFLPPSGKGVVLNPSQDNADRSHLYVDLEQGTTRRLEGERGVPAYVNDWGVDERWLLVTLGTDQLGTGAPMAILDVETGVMSRIPRNNCWKYISLDYETMLFDRYSRDSPPACTLLDLVHGQLIEFDEPCSMLSEPCQFHDGCSPTVRVSGDGKWAAFTTYTAVGSANTWTARFKEKLTGKPTAVAGPQVVTVMEAATGRKTQLGFGTRPVWLVP